MQVCAHESALVHVHDIAVGTAARPAFDHVPCHSRELIRITFPRTVGHLTFEPVDGSIIRVFHCLLLQLQRATLSPPAPECDKIPHLDPETVGALGATFVVEVLPRVCNHIVPTRLGLCRRHGVTLTPHHVVDVIQLVHHLPLAVLEDLVCGLVLFPVDRDDELVLLGGARVALGDLHETRDEKCKLFIIIQNALEPLLLFLALGHFVKGISHALAPEVQVLIYGKVCDGQLLLAPATVFAALACPALGAPRLRCPVLDEVAVLMEVDDEGQGPACPPAQTLIR